MGAATVNNAALVITAVRRPNLICCLQLLKVSGECVTAPQTRPAEHTHSHPVSILLLAGVGFNAWAFRALR